MKKYFLIMLGGTLGAILRFSLKNVQIFKYSGNIPINTLIINVTGSFVLSVLLTLSFGTWKLGNNIKLGLTVGFLGAYTTFSTLCKETAGLLEHGSFISAAEYIAASVILGLAAVYVGVFLTQKTIALIKIVKFKELINTPADID